MKKKFGTKCNFFRCRYVKSDLTQPGLLTVALLFFSVKLSVFPRFEQKNKEVKQFKIEKLITYHEENKFHTKQIR